MAKEFIKNVGRAGKLYKDNVNGIAWIEDGSSGCGFSIHSNIDANGSVSGMKRLGYWNKNDRTVKSHGFIYNIDSYCRDFTTKGTEQYLFEELVSNTCMCQGCIERRKESVL